MSQFHFNRIAGAQLFLSETSEKVQCAAAALGCLYWALWHTGSTFNRFPLLATTSISRQARGPFV
jgi:hypothetical protein